MRTIQKNRTLQALSIEEQFRSGTWEEDLPEHALDCAISNDRSSDWMLFADIAESIRGLKVAEWNRAAFHCLSYKNRHSGLILKLRHLAQLQHLTELINHDYLADLEVAAFNRKGSAISNFMHRLHTTKQGSHLFDYPLLLSHQNSSRKSWTQFQPRTSYHELADKLISQTDSFESRVMELLQPSTNHGHIEPNPIVAVVGNAPDIMDKQHGDEIDSADVVIRFNRPGATNKTRTSTGLRTDIWVMSPATDISLCPSQSNIIAVSGKHSVTRPSRYWTELARTDNNLTEFKPDIWHELVSRFSAPPTAGTLTLASLKDMSFQITVKCYGFTFDYEEHKTRQNHHADNTARSARHNWRAESNWLLENCR